LLLETGNEECGFVLQIAVSLRNACVLYLAVFVQVILMLVIGFIGNNLFAVFYIQRYYKSGSRGEVDIDTRRSYKVSAPVELW
jgi:hypothetical protein